MNYYSHHIGDFDKATRHLTRLERSIYRDLIELYYDIEKQLPLDLSVVCRKIIAKSNEEVTAVEQVLNEFFIKTEHGWFHSRCDQEITKFHSNNSQKALAGRAAAHARAKKQQQTLNVNLTDVEQTLSECAANQEPRTKNQEPRTTSEELPLVVALAIAFRKNGVATQPADPRLLALASQGINVDLINSACDAAKKAKPGEKIGIAYVLAIIERWAKSAKDLQTKGAQVPKKTEAWWVSDASVLAKGAALQLVPHPGEKIGDFKNRIQNFLDNKPNAPPVLCESVVVQINQPKRFKPSNIPALTDFLNNI